MSETKDRYVLLIHWKDAGAQLHDEWYELEECAIQRARRYARDGHKVFIYHTCGVGTKVHRRHVVHPAEIRVESD
jgi:hypothetical protein